jgi:hypothetical protein
MSHNQMTIFHPAIARINGRNIQATNRSTYLQNPANNYWYLLESLNASGEKSIETKRFCNSNGVISNFDEFFAYNDNWGVVSPILHAPTYLTCSGAASHDTFYTAKSPTGEYLDICAVKSYLDRKDDNLPIVTIKVLPNGKIVELPDNFVPSLPFQQAISPNDDDTLLANLNLAEQALRSHSPDIALALHRLMLNISYQSFGEHISNLSPILSNILMGEVTNADIEISYGEIQMLSEYRKVCGGWWEWGKSYSGRIVPYFEYV